MDVNIFGIGVVAAAIALSGCSSSAEAYGSRNENYRIEVNVEKCADLKSLPATRSDNGDCIAFLKGAIAANYYLQYIMEREFHDSRGKFPASLDRNIYGSLLEDVYKRNIAYLHLIDVPLPQNKPLGSMEEVMAESLRHKIYFSELSFT